MDISNAGEPVILPTARILPEARDPLPEYVGPSKRVNAVGQMAKAAVQDARESGIDLPKNAQGFAASRIARGADPESVFSALVVDTDDTDGGGETGAVDGTPEGDAIITAGEPDAEEGLIAPADDTGAAAAISLVPDEAEGQSPEETALNLLAEDQGT